MNYPEKIIAAVENFRKIPGVGEKTAFRQILGLSKWRTEELVSFGQALKDLATLEYCIECGLFSEGELCDVCRRSERAAAGIICVVESLSDCLAVEKSGQFRGLYHVLGGVLNPLAGIGPEEIGIPRLVQRVQRLGIKTLILAINPSIEGDATSSYIRQELPDDVSAERIGFGMPMGGALEFLDSMTITKALENRKKI
ncbi:MAG: recombination protein RecR [Halobacteriovorax sp.]|nr:recombination protein RecR [Halobacteriovorax sp.]